MEAYSNGYTHKHIHALGRPTGSERLLPHQLSKQQSVPKYLQTKPTFLGLAKTVYMHRIFGEFPAKNAVYTPYIYGSGQS